MQLHEEELDEDQDKDHNENEGESEDYVSSDLGDDYNDDNLEDDDIDTLQDDDDNDDYNNYDDDNTSGPDNNSRGTTRVRRTRIILHAKPVRQLALKSTPRTIRRRRKHALSSNLSGAADKVSFSSSNSKPNSKKAPPRKILRSTQASSSSSSEEDIINNDVEGGSDKILLPVVTSQHKPRRRRSIISNNFSSEQEDSYVPDITDKVRKKEVFDRNTFEKDLGSSKINLQGKSEDIDKSSKLNEGIDSFEIQEVSSVPMSFRNRNLSSKIKALSETETKDRNKRKLSSQNRSKHSKAYILTEQEKELLLKFSKPVSTPIKLPLPLLKSVSKRTRDNRKRRPIPKKIKMSELSNSARSLIEKFSSPVTQSLSFPLLMKSPNRF